ncbi:hypothetical protein DDSR119_39 [Pseudomonas phage DDSR119]|nr:hypothetical protein DDSR119_39 [Pseudomonas phage DDSR119]
MKCRKSELVAEAREFHKLLMKSIKAGKGEHSYRINRDRKMRMARVAKRDMTEWAAHAAVSIRPTALRCECGAHEMLRFVAVGATLHLVSF